MTDHPPAFRSNWTKMMLDYYEQHLPFAAREAVHRSLDDESRAILMGAGPLSWLPADLHMRILPAPFAALGPNAYRIFWQRMMIDSFDRPLFRGLVHGAIATFGGLSGHVFRMIPQGFSLIARGCGEFEIEATKGRADVMWRGIPSLLRLDGAFPVAWHGTLEALLKITGSSLGQVEMQPHAPNPSRVRFLVTW